MEQVEYQVPTDVDEKTVNLVKQSSDVVLATHVEPKDDMRLERARASFDALGLADFLNGGKEKRQRLYDSSML
jgi:hypothetical protein